MKLFGTVLGILLVLTLSSCKQRKPDPSNVPPAQALARVIGAQDRVNRYLQRGVVPRLMNCWTGLAGEGTIAVQAGYRRVRDLWAAGDSSLRSSTLAQGQAELALRCFQGAVRDTSFPVEEGDGEAKEFLVSWTFPVPWPKDMADVAMRMSTNPGGGGGCGGPESPGPACWDCFFIPFISLSYCGKTCAGYTNCTPIANGCQMGPITPKCVTASPFGNQGGLVMY